MVKRLLRCVREYKLPTILTLVFIVAEAVIEAIIPFLTANLVNKIETGIEMRALVGTGITLFLLAVVSLCCGGIAGYTCSRASSGFAKNIRHDIFEKVQEFSFQNIDRFSSSSLVTRLTTDVNNVQMAFMMLIRIAIRSPLMLIFSVVMAFTMGGMLAASFVVIIPVLGFGLYLIARKAMPAFRSVFKRYDRLNASVEENVRAMRVVKSFAREDYEKEKFGRAAEAICRDFTHAERIVACNMPLMQLCIYANMIFVLWIGSRIVVTSGGSLLMVGQISAMLTYGMQILMSLMMLSMILVMLTLSAESAKRIYEVLQETPALQNAENPVSAVADGSIDFDCVSFKYSQEADRNALDNISLHIPSGATVGILGGTGSGKTTLVQLIPRFYDAVQGSVRVGGIDVRRYDLETLRGAVAMVLQKNELFSGTIRDNLRWGDPDATNEEMERACVLAQADEFIRSFPDGYETVLEQGGSNVSGGQKQRLCIARALLKQPKILILDDSTSAVDTRTDALIRQGLRSCIPQTTKLIIAQRVASVQDADMILILDNGRIADCGTHEKLLRSSAIYREIYTQQTKGGSENA